MNISRLLTHLLIRLAPLSTPSLVSMSYLHRLHSVLSFAELWLTPPVAAASSPPTHAPPTASLSPSRLLGLLSSARDLRAIASASLIRLRCAFHSRVSLVDVLYLLISWSCRFLPSGEAPGASNRDAMQTTNYSIYARGFGFHTLKPSFLVLQLFTCNLVYLSFLRFEFRIPDFVYALSAPMKEILCIWCFE